MTESERIEVEVNGHFGQRIKGFLKRLVDDKAVIVYADETLTPNLRAEALLPVAAKGAPQENSFIEVLANLKLQPAPQTAAGSRLADPISCLNCPSWWPCVVSKVRDEHAVVQLKPVLAPTDESGSHSPKDLADIANNLSSMTEICESKMLRPASSPDTPCLSPDSLFKHSIPLPPELFPYASKLSLHESVLRSCGGPASLYVDNESVVVISPSLEVIRKVELVEEFHVRMLRQKCGILRYLDQNQANKEKEANGSTSDADAWNANNEEGHCVESFSVPSTLMGLVIGAQGANIQGARTSKGVIRIDVREPRRRNESGSTADANTSKQYTPYYLSVFKSPRVHIKVIAETAEDAKVARDMLEFCVIGVIVPKRLVGRIVGSKSSNIYQINEKTGLRHIHLESDPTGYGISVDNVTDPNYVKFEDPHPELAIAEEANHWSVFFLLGTRDSIEKARVLFDFQMNCTEDLETLEITKNNLLKEQSFGNRQENSGRAWGSPHAASSGDETNKSGSQPNRTRRNTNRAPHPAGEGPANHQNEVEESKSHQDETTSAATAGPSTTAAPAKRRTQGQRNGNRSQRNQRGEKGGTRVGAENNAEQNGVTNGDVKPSPKENGIAQSRQGGGGAGRRQNQQQPASSSKPEMNST